MTRRSFLTKCLAVAGAMLLPAAKAAGLPQIGEPWPFDDMDVQEIRWESTEPAQRRFIVCVIGQSRKPSRIVKCELLL